jgi:sensor histidine kinase YesM
MFMKATFLKIIKTQWIQHLGFWFLSFYILLNVLRLNNEIQKIDLIYTALFSINILAVVYVNLKILIPRFLAKKKYAWFSILSFLNLLLFSDLNIWLFNYFVDYILPNYYFISYYELEDILKFHLAFLVLTTLIKLSKAWFKMQETEKKIAQVNEEKITAELEALKSQINPHFLFNSLNNIYSLSRKSSKKTSDSILILSDMMRYVLYETRSKTVKLSDEVKFMNNFVELQKLRIDERSSIEFKVDLDNDKLKMAPLIFLPFLENSFKHGVKGNIGNTYAKFELKSVKTELLFIAENSKAQSDILDEKNQGVGLENVKRRLEILYPQKHELVIEDQEDIFKINLKLVLDE